MRFYWGKRSFGYKVTTQHWLAVSFVLIDERVDPIGYHSIGTQSHTGAGDKVLPLLLLEVSTLCSCKYSSIRQHLVRELNTRQCSLARQLLMSGYISVI